MLSHIISGLDHNTFLWPMAIYKLHFDSHLHIGICSSEMIWVVSQPPCCRDIIPPAFLSFFSFIFISWRLTTSQHFSGFCHTLTWISHGVTCVPHPNPPSHLPLHPIPLGLPSAPGLSTCLMHPTWASTSISWSGFIQISFKDNNIFSLKERLYYELELKGFPWCSSG